MCGAEPGLGRQLSRSEAWMSAGTVEPPDVESMPASPLSQQAEQTFLFPFPGVIAS